MLLQKGRCGGLLFVYRQNKRNTMRADAAEFLEI
jgi:hypothetical protein